MCAIFIVFFLCLIVYLLILVSCNPYTGDFDEINRKARDGRHILLISFIIYLIYHQYGRKECKGRSTQFNESVLKEKDVNGDLIGDWCTPGFRPGDALCIICNAVINCKQHGISAVKRHASGKKHIELCSKSRNAVGELIKRNQQTHLNFQQGKPICSTQMDSTTIAETIFAVVVANQNIPYTFADVATNVFPIMFTDSSTAKDFSVSRKKLSYIISDGIAPYLKHELVSDILKSRAFFTIQIDETPVPEKRVQQVDVLIRYFSECQQSVIVQHLESYHIGHGTAENLHNCILSALAELPQDKLLSFYSDGPNVMKSLKDKLKVSNPDLLDIGECSLHKVHNAFAHGLNDFGGDLESLLIDIFYFFKRSAAQSHDFKKLQQELDVPEHIFIRHVNSRWLTLQNSVMRFVEQFSVLQNFFQKQSLYSSREAVRLSKICEAFKDKTLLAKALFLQNASGLFSAFLKLFQKEEPLVHILYDEMLVLVKKVLGRFVRANLLEVQSGQDLKKIDLCKGENWRVKPEVGLDTENIMVDWSSSERKKFYLGARSFYKTCAAYLIKVLPLENGVLERMKCLHPLYKHEKSSLMCIKLLAGSVPNVIDISKVSTLADEWIRYQSEICVTEEDSSNLNSSTSIRIDTYWSSVFNSKDTLGNLKYKYLPILIKALLSLAHGNADCERGFSINKNIIDSRSNLNVESINGIRRIKSHIKECKGIKNFKMTPALLKSVKSSWKRNQDRLRSESIVKDNMAEEDEKLNKEKQLQLKVLHQKLDASQSMLNTAERNISEGLQKRSFEDIECGQVLLNE